VNQEGSGAWGRAWSRTRAAFDHFTGLPGTLQLCGVAAVLLVLGSLTPWFDFGGPEEFGDQYQLGVEGTVGELTLLIGVTAIVLLARMIRRGQLADSGGLAALGLLALALVAAEIIHVEDSNFAAILWGVYVSGGAAALLLLTGFLLLGGQEGAAPPD
jgi:hypothetical protein